ncbi:hypothetical protein L9F63_024669, partial [Diploptera punctata]
KRIHLHMLYNITLLSVHFMALHMNCHRFLVIQSKVYYKQSNITTTCINSHIKNRLYRTIKLRTER